MSSRDRASKVPFPIRCALAACPRTFRDAHGEEIRVDVAERLADLRGPARWRAVLWLSLDLLAAAWRLRRRPVLRPVSEAAAPKVLRARESHRAGRGTGRRAGWLDGLRVDVRSAGRALLRTPGHSATIVLTLALALGLAIDVFGVVHGVLLEPLRFDQPEELVVIDVEWTHRGIERSGVSGGELHDARRRVEAFESLAALTIRRQNLTGTDAPASQVYVGWTSGNLFEMLGVGAHRGRVFVPGEEPEVVLVSHPFWQGELGGDESVVGSKVELDGWPYTVVGVLPEDFHLELPHRHTRADFWRLPDDRWSNGDLWAEDARMANILVMVGRLRDDASLGQVQSQLAALSADLRRDFPDYAEVGWEFRATPLRDALVAEVRPLLFLLLGSVGFVLAIACANVMHLVLIRAQGRAAEIGMRLALGASRMRLVRLLLLECLLLATLAGGFGLALAVGGQRLLTALRPEGLPRFDELLLASTFFDGPVLAFGVCAVLASTLLFGLWPAWRAAATDLSGWMRGWRLDGHGGRVGPWLVATEIALSLILLTGAALLLQSLLRLQDIDPGYATDDILSASISLPSTRYDFPDDTGRFLARFEQEIATLPGVRGVSPVWPGVLDGSSWTGDLELASGEKSRAAYYLVAPSFFDALELPILEGRNFIDQDPRERVVVSQSLADALWPDRSAVGRTLRATPWGSEVDYEVIGVVPDLRLGDLRDPARPTAYFDADHWSWADWEINYAVWSDLPPSTLVPMLQERLAALDAQIPLADTVPVADKAANQRALERFALVLVGLFAAVAALLSAVGLYGVVAYSVNRRRREMGIRLALGSGRDDLVTLVLGRGARWVAAGIVLGLGGAFLLGRSLDSLLYGIASHDPKTLATVVALVAAVACAACAIPALRASRVDPATVLRAD